MKKHIITFRSLFFAVIALAGFQSCLDDIGVAVEAPQADVTLSTRALPGNMMGNIKLYTFDSNNRFVGEQLNVIKTDNMLSTKMQVGTWQFGIITGENDDVVASPDFTIPNYGSDISSAMWTTGTTIVNSQQFMKQTPELLYVPLRNIGIVADQTTTIGENDARLFRNVAKIQFVLQAHEGFAGIQAGINQHAYIDLLNVPTTISWEGKYLPNKDNPSVCAVGSALVPIRENLVFQNVSGTMVADTVEFIIPAHREYSDGASTHKLQFQISMPIAGAPFYGKSKTPIEITHSPRANHIIRVNITKFTGEPEAELNIQVSVKDWEDEINQEEEFD